MSLKEWKRLERDAYHCLEFDTTAYFLKKYFPPHGLVLDAGGGPGRYTIHLAKMGYNMVLLDFTPELLDKARRQIGKAKVESKVDKVIHGTICDLTPFEDEKFDAVLCLGGALSHVVNRKEREKAVHELARVAKRGSPIFVSVIGQLALLVTELVRFPQEIELDIFPRIRDTGDYYGGYGFAPCHFYNPEEIKKDFEKEGVTVLETVGLEGLASGHPREANRLCRERPKAWNIWWETHLRTCTQPTSAGISEHFMIICKK
jgi:ubiquinone/menaquinone biosynthesis C-methylase UbiE